ncbi:hypothetical protein MMC20_005269 [Loxospora ochrophaea]|nr:hypothetical protein [Loxospora ochrophaea]
MDNAPRVSSARLENSSRPNFKKTLEQYGFTQALPSTRSTRSSISASHQSPSPDLKRMAVDLVVSPSPKKTKGSSSGYAPPSKYAHLRNNLTDSLAPNLICVFVGLNPGLRTATVGHAYAHPSNLFYRLLHSSGCTTRRCRPEEDVELPRLFGLGNTNIVTRPTKDASELSKVEMEMSAPVLEAKIAKFRPEAVAIVGKGIWESVWKAKYGRSIKKEEFRYGWQDDRERMGVVKDADDSWTGARVFVATTTSGLAASMQLHEKEEIWRGLGEWVEKRRLERKGEFTDGKQEHLEDNVKVEVEA